MPVRRFFRGLVKESRCYREFQCFYDFAATTLWFTEHTGAHLPRVRCHPLCPRLAVLCTMERSRDYRDFFNFFFHVFPEIIPSQNHRFACFFGGSRVTPQSHRTLYIFVFLMNTHRS